MKQVAIIGGGIVGMSCAHFLQSLSPEPIEITIFDNGKGQATKASAGIISPWLSQRRNKDWYALAKEGARLYPEWLAEMNLSDDKTIYQQVGTLLFKKNEALLDKLYHLALERRKEAPEIGDIARLTPEEIKEKIPLIETSQSALFISGGARLDGQRLMTAIRRELTKQTVTFEDTAVLNLSYSDKKQWTVHLENRKETFEQVVLATGAWLPHLLTPLGYEVDVRPQKGQLLVLDTDFPSKDWPVIMPQGEGDIIPLRHGEILIGATHENEGGFDLTVDTETTQPLIDNLIRLVPQLKGTPIKTVRIGTRAYTSDFLPFFGCVPGQDNLFVASGLGSSGLTTGPVIGKTLAQMLLNIPTNIDPSHYSPVPYIKKEAD
ncbi:NAD(P)/FAD-dependent oxidoreductase [Vagococcus lutrae]|uniref:NAD(P)/FAD-dependent oxidoreductase n=1 Tax=Vagococcus lutrae TaxID=81947 RepID=UPI00288C742B|nr:FAD-dependent oxidoreductase [Vagococcus lutrae]MDT2805607.1 FAD-dependent oxidoreductase [Vagococcus lutrae]